MTAGFGFTNVTFEQSFTAYMLVILINVYNGWLILIADRV